MLPLLPRQLERTIRQLRYPESREAQGLFVIEGLKGVEEALDSSFEVVCVVVNGERYRDHAHLPEERSFHLPTERFAIISQLKTPPEILAVLRIPTPNLEDVLLTRPHLLYCAHIAEPGNLGTLQRSAAWFGVSTLLLGPESVSPYNSKTVQATMGAVFTTHCFPRKNVAEDLQKLKALGYQIVITDSQAERTTPMPGPLCIVLGSESHGIPAEVLAFADIRYGIPKLGSGESLNVGVAGSLVLFDLMVAKGASA